MALKKSEKILAGTTGALLAMFAGVFLFSGGGKSLSNLRADRESLNDDIERLTAEAHPGKKASEQLDRWRERSLPTDPEDPNVARREYGDWLLDLAAERVKLGGAEITPFADQRHGGAYTVLPFKVEGRGTLDQLVRFLFEFERAGYLHNVRQWSSTPIKGSQELKLVFDIDAVSLPGAEQKDKLPVGLPSRLEHADLDEYLKTIVPRQMEGERFAPAGGLFASYAPKPPDRPEGNGGPSPPPSGPEGVDPSSLTHVSSIRMEDGVPKVWFFIRTEGRKIELHEGDPFEVGKMRGTIARIRIDELDVEIKLDGGERQLVAFGKFLSEGVELHE
ncbi:MAG: hypothetical protein ACYSWU_10280 [Planctomycetota bacterium]|jgi:hypothetical protein